MLDGTMTADEESELNYYGPKGELETDELVNE